MKLFVILFSGFFILLGGIFLTIGIVSIVTANANKSAEMTENSEKYTKVTATVKGVETKTKREHDEDGWHTYKTTVIRLSYEANGTQYESELKQNIDGLEEGDKIEVYYYNDMPTQLTYSLSDDSSNAGSGGFWVIFGAVWLIISIACLVIGLREARNA